MLSPLAFEVTSFHKRHVPVSTVPKYPQQVLRVYCYDCRRVHLSIEACE